MDYELLTKLRKVYEESDEHGREVLAKEFPELAESIDDRMFTCLKKELRNLKSQGYNIIEGEDVTEISSWLEKKRTEWKHNRMAPIYDNKESFETALEEAWEFYNKSASRTVDSFEDNYVECTFAKGFREGFLFGMHFQS